MKKLFQLSPLLELNDYQRFKIFGSYHIDHIDQQKCIFRHEAYSITIEADEIDVRALQEQQVLILIDGFRSMVAKKMSQDD